MSVRSAAARATVAKLCGADVELGNFLLGTPGLAPSSGWVAARLLLDRIPGTAHRAPALWLAGSPGSGSTACTASFDDGGHRAEVDAESRDWGRKFLATNGGCVYIDLAHLELCLPEVISAWDHLACWHAMLAIAREALGTANAALPPGAEIKVLVNSSDGQGNSYGSHLNFLVTRRCFENLFRRKLHHLLLLASYLASGIVLTGAGKAGVEHGEGEADFQISQRADFFTRLAGPMTTHDRPLVNSREEHHAREDLARLHLIFCDSAVAHGTCLLRVGVTQLVLAMIEQEVVDPRLVLEDPVHAAKQFSRDPELRCSARLLSGRRASALAHQRALFEQANRFVATGRAAGVVPRADEILALWEDTLTKLEREPAALVGRLEWVLKRAFLTHAVRRRGLDWRSPDLRHLDQIFHSLDPEEGLFWIRERAGCTERLVDAAAIAHFRQEPPADTRAYTRAHLLRLAGDEAVANVDWGSIRFRLDDRGYLPRYRTQELADPLGFGRAATRDIFACGASLDDVLDAL
ncbi:MAG: proteasome accessory factor PafA2 family protein [Planctomycetes bacterium]|nr:proteasome accessory factor PafA2 family protein [Planctomycetota bacterium]